MALDVGTKQTGMAVYCPGFDPCPTPRGILDGCPEDDIVRIVREEDIHLIIVGIPYSRDGSETKMARKIKKWALKLEMTSPVPVCFQDETLSSFEAEERMKQSPRYNFKVDKKKVHSVAACVILEDFIRHHPSLSVV